MAEPDLLTSIVEQLHERLEQLRPLVADYQRLQAAEHALSATKTPKAPPRRGGRAENSNHRFTGGSGNRDAARERLLTIIGQRPGVTKSELRTASKLPGPTVAQQLRRLRDRAQIHETQLPSGDVGYRLAGAHAATR